MFEAKYDIFDHPPKKKNAQTEVGIVGITIWWQLVGSYVVLGNYHYLIVISLLEQFH